MRSQQRTRVLFALLGSGALFVFAAGVACLDPTGARLVQPEAVTETSSPTSRTPFAPAGTLVESPPALDLPPLALAPIEGTVVRTDEDELAIRDDVYGFVHRLGVDDETVAIVDGLELSADQLPEGTQVRASWDMKGDTPVARDIELNPER